MAWPAAAQVSPPASAPTSAPPREVVRLPDAERARLLANDAIRLPALGEGASEDLSISAERRIGEEVMREGRRDPAYLDDPVLLAYLNSLWRPLVETARLKGEIVPEIDSAFAWEAFLVRDRSVNAFAMPGGFVGVHLGLIALTSTADQLASVLAHELSHVTQRHIARSIAPQQRASLLAIAGLLLAVAVAGRNVDGANAAIAGGQAAAIQSQLNYSRDMEREADRIGFGVLSAAGFSPVGMSAMFERLDQANRLNDNSGFPYLRSHPLTLDRVAEARNRTLLSHASAPAPTLVHAMMQMRARVLMDDSVTALRRLSGETSSPELSDRVAAAYGAALAASMLNEHDAAQAHAARALALASQAPQREPAAVAAAQTLQVQLALARQDAERALQVLGSTEAPTRDARRPLLLLRAQALLHQHQQAEGTSGGNAKGDNAAALKDSTEALQTWLADAPADALVWQALAGTSEALGMGLRSQRANAEARAAVGDLMGAIDRLRAAQQASRGGVGQDFIEGSVIDTRLRQLLAQRRQMALDARETRGGRREPEDPSPQVRG